MTGIKVKLAFMPDKATDYGLASLKGMIMPASGIHYTIKPC